MKTNLILFTLLFLASCEGGSIKTAKEAHSNLVKHEDSENKVICYSLWLLSRWIILH
jgi:hypothetical protein